jgi:hypothetical protein
LLSLTSLVADVEECASGLIWFDQIPEMRLRCGEIMSRSARDVTMLVKGAEGG